MFALAGWEMRLHPVSQNNARDRQSVMSMDAAAP